MHKLVTVAFASAALACGSSSKPSSSLPSGPLTGTIGGRAFSPTTLGAVSVGSASTPCSITGVGSLGVRAVAFAATTYADSCGDLTIQQCQRHASSQKVTVLVAKANPVSPYSEPSLTPGSYPVASSITGATPMADGTLNIAYAEAVAMDPACAGTAHPSVGGTVWIDQVSGPITGHVSISFDDGSSVSGEFSAPMCSSTPNVCALALSGAICTTPASACQ